MPQATSKRRQRLDPISYDELMSNAGMSGFVSFLENAHAAVVEPPAPAQPPPFRWAKNGRGRQSRIWKATQMQDGHSLAEQAVYDALWHRAEPLLEPDCEDRAIRIGYHRLAQMTRLSWVSVKANLRSLERKLAIEVTGCENSATQEGKQYRIYSPAAILERRKRAGLEWVRRTRGVELLTEASFHTAEREFQRVPVGV